MDDTIVFSKNIEEHKRHLNIVLSKLKAVGLKLNKNKRKFFATEIKNLGNIVKQGKIYPDPEKKKFIEI